MLGVEFLGRFLTLSKGTAQLLLCLAASLMGCHSANPEPIDQVLSSKVTLSDIDPAAWNISSDTKWWMCRNEPPSSKFTHGNVAMAIGIPDLIRFDRTNQKCNLKIVTELSDWPNRPLYQGKNCDISFPSKLDEELMIFVRYAEESARNVERCQYRFALWALGSGEFADLPDDELFVPREQTVWSGFDYFPEDILKVRPRSD